MLSGLKTLYAFYDLAIGPVSFDVIPFLIQSKLAQERFRCERVHFVIVPATNGVDGFRDKSNLYDVPEMHWRLWNIVVPACRMAGGAVTVATDWDEAKRLPRVEDVCWPLDWDRQTLDHKPYLQKEIVAAAKMGTRIPKLQALEHARRAVRRQVERARKPLVTITLRNTYEQERNSDEMLWEDVYEGLRYRFHVVRLFDTQDELNKGYGYGALNLELRAALYSEAVQNFHVHNGPAILNWFLDAPFVEFGAARPHKYWAANWVKNVGLEIGEQIPWARPDQRLRYEEVTDEVVAEEMNRLNEKLAA
jgi:hypothetical protein